MMNLLKYLFLLLPCILLAQTNKLVPVKTGTKWGFMDHTKKMIIAPQYDRANPFAEYEIYDRQSNNQKRISLAKVFVDKKMKCIFPDNSEISCNNLSSINENTQMTVSILSENELKARNTVNEDDEKKMISSFEKDNVGKFDKIQLVTKKPVYFRVTKGGKSGVVDPSGKIILPINFNFIETKSYKNQEGSREFYFIGTANDQSKPDLYYSQDGKLFIENFIPYFPIHQSGLFIRVKDSKEKYKIYNLQSKKYINRYLYDKLAPDYQNGLLLVQREGKEFYIDETGKEYVYQ